MPEDNVWLAERSAEQSAMERILVVLDSPATDGAAMRGAGLTTADAPPDSKEGSRASTFVRQPHDDTARLRHAPSAH